MVKRKFMTDAEWVKRQEHHRDYQLIQNARKNERRALLVKALVTPKPTIFQTVKAKYNSIARKKENKIHENTHKRWNRAR